MDSEFCTACRIIFNFAEYEKRIVFFVRMGYDCIDIKKGDGT